MYVITITNIDHNLLEVEVSVDVYKVYEDSRRQEERQRYERRKHIDGMILSILVDTFSSRISLTMPPSPKPHNIACVLS